MKHKIQYIIEDLLLVWYGTLIFLYFIITTIIKSIILLITCTWIFLYVIYKNICHFIKGIKQ